MSAVAVLPAQRSTLKHFKGESGCCGGGGEPRAKRKKLQGQAAGEKVLRIEGIHCENCKNCVERLLNQPDGAAAKACLNKNIAVVSMSREIGNGELKAAAATAGCKVTGIKLRRKA